MRPFPFAHSRSIIVIAALLLILLACGQTAGNTPLATDALPTSASPFATLSIPTVASSLTTPSIPTDPTDTQAANPTLPSTDSIQVFFTDPSARDAQSYSGGPDQFLVASIDGSQLSIDVAAYSFNLWSIRDALIRAVQRGVVVRMVMESDNMDGEEVQALKDAGINILGDQRQGLMHDKFIVIDRSEVWTGSLNFTAGGTYKDNNDLLRIRSAQAAEIFTAQFNQMFVDNLFGPDVRNEDPAPGLMVDGTPLDILFSPDNKVAAHLLPLIQSARESIYILAYSFTSNDLGDAVMQRAREGVKVQGVMDASQVASNQGTEYDRFIQAGLDIRQDGNNGLMHHKVLIIDGKTVVTGSYNFTNAAETENDENLVIITSTSLAQQYLDEFQKIYAQGQK